MSSAASSHGNGRPGIQIGCSRIEPSSRITKPCRGSSLSSRLLDMIICMSVTLMPLRKSLRLHSDFQRTCVCMVNGCPFYFSLVRMTLMRGVLNVYGTNVVTTEGNAWRFQRKITSRPFSEKNNQLVHEESVRQAQQMSAAWGKASSNGAYTVVRFPPCLVRGLVLTAARKLKR